MLPVELPTFEATWWPVMLETVPGSGERLAVAAVVKANSGQSQVRQLITPAALNSMFGTAGAGMRLIVGKTTLHLQRQLDAGVGVADLAFPFGGIEFGAARDCVARDLNEVFEVAFRLGGAFGVSHFGAVEKPSHETRRAFDEWAEKVRVELLNMVEMEQLRDAFNVSVSLPSHKKTRIGFLHGGYAASFGVLRPGKPASSDMRALKVKVFDFEALRRVNQIFARRTEILVGYPDASNDGAFSRREIESQRDSWEFIDFEARQRNVRLLRYSTAREAALYLQQQQTAA